MPAREDISKMQNRRQSWVPRGAFCLGRRGKLFFKCLPRLKVDFSCLVKQESPSLADFLTLCLVLSAQSAP